MIILSGPPGSGKGTQAQKLAANAGYQLISVGDTLRTVSQTNPDIERALAAGDLVSTALMTPILESVLPAHHAHVVLDGAPREPAQSRWLLGWLAAHPDGESMIIELQIDDALSQERTASRGRTDDTTAVVRDRLAEYHTLTQPAIQLLSPPVVFHAVDASLSVEVIYERITSYLPPKHKGAA
jgi:adenylate kinase